jgi:anti-sigma factor RsiW
MDGELVGDEAMAVEQHVRGCAGCRARVASYGDMSRQFAAYHAASAERAMAAPKDVSRRVPPWIPVALAAAAAVVLALVLLPRAGKVEQVPAAPKMAQAVAATAVPTAVHPAAKVETVAKAATPVRQRRQVAARKPAPATNWALAGPAIQIEIPMAEMFPPGAVPEGATYIANLSLTADGSVQGIRPQP